MINDPLPDTLHVPDGIQITPNVNDMIVDVMSLCFMTIADIKNLNIEDVDTRLKLAQILHLQTETYSNLVLMESCESQGESQEVEE